MTLWTPGDTLLDAGSTEPVEMAMFWEDIYVQQWTSFGRNGDADKAIVTQSESVLTGPETKQYNNCIQK